MSCIAYLVCLSELITIFNAVILGATTTPVFVVARVWRNLVMTEVLVGVFGYALGAFIGTLLFKHWIRLFQGLNPPSTPDRLMPSSLYL